MAAPAVPKSRILLLCGLGNPGSGYARTRHNLGQIVVDHLQKQLRSPPFAQSSGWGGTLSLPPNHTGDEGGVLLFKPSAYMNNSGKSVKKAWDNLITSIPQPDKPRATLVVLYDDLESNFGAVKLAEFGKGKGHNGIKSCNAHLGFETYFRIKLGTGRPESRDPEDVARFVLDPFTGGEWDEVERSVVPRVIQMIEKIRNRPYA
ncbi:peptidyl-tRNA hydrolase [Saitoella complicata NRRL Y-17804]|nr:peptidyl-tRNA hydrolase [Saitoella complicata NRRL Y-17804]ODQ51284.1 peptidyl-tRNA hydrolase [Saitoella complicata NRRL Y-17804]